MWDQIKQELSVELDRHRRKKYGRLVAILIYYIILTISPVLIQRVLPTLLQNLPSRIAYVVVVTAAIAGSQAFWLVFMFIVYKGKQAIFQQDRIDPQRPWPWQEDNAKWQQQFWGSLRLIAFNTLIFAPINLFAETILDFSVDMNPDNAPKLLWVVPQFVLMMLVEDLTFYFFHRLLHTPALYKYHKRHHEFTTTVSIVGLHSEFLEFFLTQSLTYLACSRVACFYGPVHISTVFSWFIYRISDANCNHSGYNFSWSLLQLMPFCTYDDFHYFHHTKNSGNYASQFRIWDIMLGTDNDFVQFKRLQGQRDAKID